jgi:hypothetical protein
MRVSPRPAAKDISGRIAIGAVVSGDAVELTAAPFSTMTSCSAALMARCALTVAPRRMRDLTSHLSDSTSPAGCR